MYKRQALAQKEIPAKMAQIRSDALQGLRQSRAGVSTAWDSVSRLCATGIQETQGRLGRHMQDIGHDAQQQLEQSRQSSQALVREITGQGPQRTLNRGFALVRDSQGRPVTRAAALNPQSGSPPSIRIEFADGQRSARLLPPDPPDTP